MQEMLIAPCGMNCTVCVHYQSLKNNLNQHGFKKTYCPGCLPRGKNCPFMKDQCELVGNGLIRFCFECEKFPCRRLKALDTRYRTKYHLSMIDNLLFIKEQGMKSFLEKEAAKWGCSQCGGEICCHNGLCLNCDIEILRQNKKHHWGIK